MEKHNSAMNEGNIVSQLMALRSNILSLHSALTAVIEEHGFGEYDLQAIELKPKSEPTLACIPKLIFEDNIIRVEC